MRGASPSKGGETRGRWARHCARGVRDRGRGGVVDVGWALGRTWWRVDSMIDGRGVDGDRRGGRCERE
jgi:hypothetical protein